MHMIELYIINDRLWVLNIRFAKKDPQLIVSIRYILRMVTQKKTDLSC